MKKSFLIMLPSSESIFLSSAPQIFQQIIIGFLTVGYQIRMG